MPTPSIYSPTNLLLQKIGDNVKLTWVDNNIVATGYVIKKNDNIINIAQNSTIITDGLGTPPTKTISNANMTSGGFLGLGKLWNYILDKTKWGSINSISTNDGVTPTINITGTGFPVITIALNEIDLTGINELTSINWNTSETVDLNSYLLLSVDGGTTYNAFNGSSWVTVDINTADDVVTKGNSSSVINNLTTAQINALRGSTTKIKFAYCIETDQPSTLIANHSIDLVCKDTGNAVITKSYGYSARTGNTTSYLDTEVIKGNTDYIVYSTNLTIDDSVTARNVTIPLTPTNFSSTTTGLNLTYNWDVVNCDGYKVYDGNNTLLTTTPLPTYSVTFPSEQSLSIYVKAYTTEGESDPTSTITTSTSPNAPTSLLITKQSDGFQLDWTDNSNVETGFKVQRKNGVDWIDLDTLGNVTTYKDIITITTNTLYEYRVCAINTSGNSDFASNSFLSQPNIPTNLVGSSDGYNVVFSWDAISCDGYKVYNGGDVLLNTITENTFTIVPPESTANTEIALPTDKYANYIILKYDDGVSVVYNCLSSDVAIDPVLISSTDKYKIYYKRQHSTGENDKIWNMTVNNGTDSFGLYSRSAWEIIETSYTKIKDDLDNVVYSIIVPPEHIETIYVTAFNSGGESLPTDKLTYQSIPNEPTNLIMTQLANGFKLDWTDNSSLETEYKIHKRVQNGEWSDIGNTTSATYTDLITIQPNTLYEYKVCAINTSGETTGISKSTLSLPITPTNLICTANGFNLTFTWDTVSCDGYKVYDGNNILLDTVTATNYVFTNSSEQAKTINVTAYNSNGESGHTSNLEGKSLPNAPTNLLITQQSNGFQLDWTDNSNIETGFKIRKRVQGGEWSNIGTVEGTTYTEIVTIISNELYEYEICATNTTGDSSLVVWGTEILDSPTLSSEVDDINNTITYTWTSNPVASGYKLYISDTVNGDSVLDSTSLSYTYSMVGEAKQSAYIVANLNTDYGVMNSSHSNTVNPLSLPKNNVTNIDYGFDVSNGIKLVGSFNDKSKIEDGFRIKYNLNDSGWQYLDIISTSVGTIDNTYNFTLDLGNNPLSLAFNIGTYNSSGVSEYSPLIVLLPKVQSLQSAYISDTYEAKFGWVDNSISEYGYRFYSSIDNGVYQVEDVISNTSNSADSIYTKTITLEPSSSIKVYVCTINNNGYLGLPSLTETSFDTYHKPSPPLDFKAVWVEDGVVEFSWTDSLTIEKGYIFKYSINGGEEQAIDYPSDMDTIGGKFTKLITINNNLDMVQAKVVAYTIVDTSNDSNLLEMTYMAIPTDPPTNFKREKTDIGVVLTWDACEYVVNYEVNYSINGIDFVAFTTDTAYEINLDYNSAKSFSAYVIVHFNGGKNSAPTSTITFDPTIEYVPFAHSIITIGLESLGITEDITITKKIKQYFNDEEAIYNYGVETIITGFITICGSFGIKSYSDVRTNIFTHLITEYPKLDILYTKINEENYLVDYVYDSGIITDSLLETRSIDKSLVDKYNLSTIIKNQKVSTYFNDSMNMVTSGTITNYLLNTLNYSKASFAFEPIHYTIFTKFTNEAMLETIVHKITISCLGDSIMAGHPGYWAESGTGRVTSQMEYWLQKRLGDDFVVINKGYGSDTTLKMLNRFDKDIVPTYANYVILQGGTNDIYIAQVNVNKTQEYLDSVMAVTRANMVEMVRRTKAMGAIPILATLLPRTGTIGIYRQAIWDYNEWLKEYADANEDVYCVDWYNAGKDTIPPLPIEEPNHAGNFNPMLDGDSVFDIYGNLVKRGSGTHPSDAGYKLLAEVIPLTIFKSLTSGVKMYLDEDCTVEEDNILRNKIEITYKLNLSNLNRGRTKSTTRYIKNIGNKPVIFALYPTLLTGVGISLSLNGSEFGDSISGQIDSQSVVRIDIKVDVPKFGDEPKIALDLLSRSYSNVIVTQQ